MGQASKGFPKKSTGGGLRCRSKGPYKEMTTIKNGTCNLRRKKKRTHCTQISLIQYKNISSSDLIEDRYFHQFVFSVLLAWILLGMTFT